MIQGMTTANKDIFKKLYKQFIGNSLGSTGDSQNSNHKDLDTGKSHTHYENRTKEQMYNLAREMHIDGRSNMNKEELIEAVRNNRH